MGLRGQGHRLGYGKSLENLRVCWAPLGGRSLGCMLPELCIRPPPPVTAISVPVGAPSTEWAPGAPLLGSAHLGSGDSVPMGCEAWGRSCASLLKTLCGNARALEIISRPIRGCVPSRLKGSGVRSTPRVRGLGWGDRYRESSKAGRGDKGCCRGSCQPSGLTGLD